MPDPYVRPEVRQFLDYLNKLPNQKAFELPLGEARNMLHASRRVADAEVGELAVIRDLEDRWTTLDATEVRHGATSWRVAVFDGTRRG